MEKKKEKTAKERRKEEQNHRGIKTEKAKIIKIKIFFKYKKL